MQEQGPTLEQVRKVEVSGEILDILVGAYISRTVEGRKEVLLVQHRDTKKWYFPGGKIRIIKKEDGTKRKESLKEGLRRELKEELGVDYEGKFDSFTVDVYEINGKKLAIANVVARDPLLSEPATQEKDAIYNFVWTSDPLSFDLTDQAKRIIETKIENESAVPDDGKKIKDVPGNYSL